MAALAYTQNDLSNNSQTERGILRVGDALYPSKLSSVLEKRAPAELHYIGNIDLLEKRGIGFCGSRNASEKGLMTAEDCAEQVVQNDHTVISGYASGVDLAAHKTALESGGSTIIILPEGVSHFRIKKALQDVWDWSRVLVLSQFKPSDPWQAYRAMSRNQIIIGLSTAMIVIEAQDKGGTFEAGKSTLKLKMPLFVAEYEDMDRTPGNSLLFALGATRLKKLRSTERASLSQLFTVEAPSRDQALPVAQMHLL